jgi:FG-GAP repeat protein
MKNNLIIISIAFIATLFCSQSTFAAGDGSIDSTIEINDLTTNGPVLNDSDSYGSAVENIGDLDGDGVDDIAIGAFYDDAGGTDRGAVHIHFMNIDGSVKSTVEINHLTINGPVLSDGDRYGYAIANLNDLNNDGVQDITVGSYRDDTGGTDQGAVYIHFMNTDGSIDSTVKINDSTINGPTLSDGDLYGISIENLGDLNNDSVEDIMVGATGDDTGGINNGTVHIHFMNTDGSIDSTIEINHLTINGPTLDGDQYGESVANIGDLNNDGVNDIAVGAVYDSLNGTSRGTIHIHFMNTDGSVKSTVEINDLTVNGPDLADSDYYGESIVNMGDLDGDGVQDIAVGAYLDDAGGANRGTIHIHFMNTDGSVKSTVEINDNTTNGPVLSDADLYSASITNIGDLNNDGVQDLIVTARYDDAGGIDRGAIHIHFLTNKAQTQTDTTSTIGTTTAIGNAEITDIGTQNPTREIEWGTVSKTYTDDCTAGTGGTGSYSCDMTDLTPDTTYYIRAKATNEKGIVYGQEQSFTTNALTSQIVIDPDTIDMDDLTTNGYITVDNGTLDNTTQTTTNEQITFQSPTTNAIFPTSTVITEASAGLFNFQNFITQNTLTSEKVEHPNAIGAVRLGIPNENLSFSNDITIEMNVSEAYNDMELEVLSQLEGSTTWNTHTTCTITNGICSFTTNHATTYIVNGDGTITGIDDLNLNVEVNATLSMDCYDKDGVTGDYDVILGTVANPGIVIAGTPAVGESTCIVTTNDTQGYYLSMINDNGASNTTLVHSNNTDEIPDLTQFSETTKTTETWNAPTTKGLGFSVIQFPQNDTTHNTFNNIWTTSGDLCEEGTTNDDAEYAGVPQTAQAIAAYTAYNSTSSTTDVCYKVDVSPSQPSGVYTGSVTYTATSDASGYYQ